eukprot:Hpha_TRINITY_DN11817_c0_g1::TRINITY_DN11817_c0_g1_i1::g.2088::m.2088
MLRVHLAQRVLENASARLKDSKEDTERKAEKRKRQLLRRASRLAERGDQKGEEMLSGMAGSVSQVGAEEAAATLLDAEGWERLNAVIGDPEVPSEGHEMKVIDGAAYVLNQVAAQDSGSQRLLKAVAETLRIIDQRYTHQSYKPDALRALLSAALTVLHSPPEPHSKRRRGDGPAGECAAVQAACHAVNIVVTHSGGKGLREAVVAGGGKEVRLALVAHSALPPGSNAAGVVRLLFRRLLFEPKALWLQFFAAARMLSSGSDAGIEEGEGEGDHVKSREAERLGELLKDPSADWRAVCARAGREVVRAKKEPGDAEGAGGRKVQLMELLEGVFGDPQALLKAPGWSRVLVNAFADAQRSDEKAVRIRAAAAAGNAGDVATIRFAGVLLKVIAEQKGGEAELAELAQGVAETGCYHSQSDLLYHSGSAFHILSALATASHSAIRSARSAALRACGALLPLFHKLVEPHLDALCTAAVEEGTEDARAFVETVLRCYSALQSIDAPLRALGAARLNRDPPAWLCAGEASVFATPFLASLDPVPAADALLEALNGHDIGVARVVTAVANAIPLRPASAQAVAMWVDKASTRVCRPLAKTVRGPGQSDDARAALLEAYFALQSLLDRAAPQLLYDLFDWGSGVLTALLGRRGGGEKGADHVPFIHLPAADELPELSLSLADIGVRMDPSNTPIRVMAAAGRCLMQRARRLKAAANIKRWGAEGVEEECPEAEVCADAVLRCAASTLRSHDEESHFLSEALAFFSTAAEFPSCAAAVRVFAEAVVHIVSQSLAADPEVVQGHKADLTWRSFGRARRVRAVGKPGKVAGLCFGLLESSGLWESRAGCEAIIQAAVEQARGGGLRDLRAARAVLERFPAAAAAGVSAGEVGEAVVAKALKGDKATVIAARDFAGYLPSTGREVVLKWVHRDDRVNADEGERQAAVSAAVKVLSREKRTTAEVVRWVEELLDGPLGPSASAAAAQGLFQVCSLCSERDPAPPPSSIRPSADLPTSVKRAGGRVDKESREAVARLAAKASRIGEGEVEAVGLAKDHPLLAGAALIAALLSVPKQELDAKLGAAAAAAVGGLTAVGAAGPTSSHRWLAGVLLTVALKHLSPEARYSLSVWAVDAALESAVVADPTAENTAAAIGVLADEGADELEDSVVLRLRGVGGQDSKPLVGHVLSRCRDAFMQGAEAVRKGEEPAPRLAAAARVLSDFIASWNLGVSEHKQALRSAISEALVASHLLAARSDTPATRELLRLVGTVASTRRIPLGAPEACALMQLPRALLVGGGGPGFPVLLLRAQDILRAFLTRRQVATAGLWSVLVTALGGLFRSLFAWAEKTGVEAEEPIREQAGVDAVSQVGWVTEAALVDACVRLLEHFPGARRRAHAAASGKEVAIARAHAPALLTHFVSVCAAHPVVAERHHRELSRGAEVLMRLCTSVTGADSESKRDIPAQMAAVFRQLPESAKLVFKGFHRQSSSRRTAPR